MVAQVACIHAQGFGINFVPLHHIVAKAPCIARGTMLKPGSSPGFFRLVCTRIFLFLDTKKRPKLLKFGRFVYIFVYVLRKTLIFKVYCGETGIRTLDTVTRMPHFECGPFDHSGISPLRGVLLCLCHAPEGWWWRPWSNPFRSAKLLQPFHSNKHWSEKASSGQGVFIFRADGLYSLSRGFLSFRQESQAFRAGCFSYSDRSLRLSELRFVSVLTEE